MGASIKPFNGEKIADFLENHRKISEKDGLVDEDLREYLNSKEPTASTMVSR